MPAPATPPVLPTIVPEPSYNIPIALAGAYCIRQLPPCIHTCSALSDMDFSPLGVGVLSGFDSGKDTDVLLGDP